MSFTDECIFSAISLKCHHGRHEDTSVITCSAGNAKFCLKYVQESGVNDGNNTIDRRCAPPEDIKKHGIDLDVCDTMFKTTYCFCSADKCNTGSGWHVSKTIKILRLVFISIVVFLLDYKN